MRTLAYSALWLVLAYFVVRALAEPFTVDYANYSRDWGGPTLAGVFAVHMVPGVVAGAVMAYTFRRWRKRRQETR